MLKRRVKATWRLDAASLISISPSPEALCLGARTLRDAYPDDIVKTAAASVPDLHSGPLLKSEAYRCVQVPRIRLSEVRFKHW